MTTRAASPHRRPVWGALVLSIACLLPVRVTAVSTTCLTGTAPEVAGDPADIGGVRALIDAACPCAAYDGSPGNTHGAYVRCATSIIDQEIGLANLRARCKGTVKRYYARASCGFAPSLGKHPCIKTKTANGKVTCSIKSGAVCVDKPTFTAESCPAFTHCIDAADTNDDLRIAAPGDDGQCVAAGPVLVSFAPASGVFAREGELNAPTIPSALTVTLGAAPAVNTFVAVDSNDSGSLSVVGGGVTVLAGTASAPVLLDAIAPSAAVTLTATLGPVSLQSTVRVVGATESPVLVSLTPAETTIAAFGSAPLTATLDIPAGVGGAEVTLAVVPPGAGSVPVSVTVPEDQLSAAFDYDDGGLSSSVTVEATLVNTHSATVNVVP